MDYLDRPFSHGRETIIYAPMTNPDNFGFRHNFERSSEND